MFSPAAEPNHAAATARQDLEAMQQALSAISEMIPDGLISSFAAYDGARKDNAVKEASFLEGLKGSVPWLLHNTGQLDQPWALKPALDEALSDGVQSLLEHLKEAGLFAGAKDALRVYQGQRDAFLSSLDLPATRTLGSFCCDLWKYLSRESDGVTIAVISRDIVDFIVEMRHTGSALQIGELADKLTPKPPLPRIPEKD